METQEQNPLLNLSPDKQQQLVDLVQNGDIDSVAEATGMTRREVILAGAALAAGTLGGGYTMEQLVSEVEAAASTSDSDGNVGLPGDRVDVFAESADVSGTVGAGAVNTEEASITDGASGSLTHNAGGGFMSEGGSPMQPLAVSEENVKNDTPAMWHLGGSEWLCVYRHGPNGVDPSGDDHLRQIRSYDGGASWTEPEIIWDSQYAPLTQAATRMDDGTLIICIDETDGQLDGHQRAITLRSTDDGESWTRVGDYPDKGRANAELFGMITINGTLYLPVGSSTADDSTQELYVATSSDSGTSWTVVSTVASDDWYVEPDLVELPNGILLLARSRTESYAPMTQWDSTDGGSSWTLDGNPELVPFRGHTIAPRPYYDSDTDECRLIWVARDGPGRDVATRFTDLPVAIFGYSRANASTVLGDNTAWDNYIWAIQSAVHGDGTKGYGYVAEDNNGNRLIPMSWTVDSSSRTKRFQLSLTSEQAVEGLITKSQYLGFFSEFSTTWQTLPASNVQTYINKQTIIDTSSPATSDTSISFADNVPKSASEVLIDVGLDGDGTSGAATQAFFTLDSGKRVGHHNDGPSDDGTSNFESRWIPIQGDRTINYRTANASSFQVDLLGYR